MTQETELDILASKVMAVETIVTSLMSTIQTTFPEGETLIRETFESADRVVEVTAKHLSKPKELAQLARLRAAIRDMRATVISE
jgi:hypothetical protein